MLDIKRIVADPETANDLIARRERGASFASVLGLSEERRSAITRFNELRHQQKELSQAFGNRQIAPEDMGETRAKLKAMSQEVKDLDARAKELEAAMSAALLDFPNLPDPEAPVGYGEDDNVVVSSWGEPGSFDFEPKSHDALGAELGILDFEAAARVSGAGFALYRGLGARLERALASFMLDLHVDAHGYQEVYTPYLVTRDAMIGTGQLPKFEDDAFRLEADDLFMIPTAEVSVTNMHREQILDDAQLPTCYAAYSSCFRREAGSYGKESRGLTRLHQFQKVELVQFTRPEESHERHLLLRSHAEKVLQLLELPYRVVDLCTGDIGFAAKRCFDLEVWLPGQKMWREISSCSNFGDFQARRAGIRYRPEPKAKPRFVHTLNGSGLAVGRTIMALLEVHQRPDGGVNIPEALRPYMRVERIEPR